MKKNLVKYFIPIFLTMCLSYTFYRSEIVYKHQLFNFYIKYYVILILSIFFYILFIKKISNKFTYIVISLLISLYLVESLLTVSEIYKEKKFKSKFLDKRSKLEVYLDFKGNAVPTIPSFDIITKYPDNKLLGLSGISNKKTIFCNESGYWAIYDSDRYGFNNPDKEWDAKEIDYLIVGDSFAHGACVNEKDSVGSNLRIISNKRLLNLGIEGNGPMLEYATLREYLKIKKVNRVVWIYTGNDIFDLRTEKKNNILNEYIDNKDFTQNLKFKQYQIDKIYYDIVKTQIDNSKKKIIDEKNKKIFGFLRLSKIREKTLDYYNINKKTIKISEQEFEEYSKILKLAKKFVEENNSKFYFVYVANNYVYHYNNFDENYIHQNLIKILKNLNIDYIDIHEELIGKHPDPKSLFPHRGPWHFNENGYKLIASHIYKRIAEMEKR